MIWTQQSTWVLVSDLGFRVSKGVVGDVVSYSAWAPDIGRNALDALMLERYAVGESAPVRCACLGVYTSSADARARCEAHDQGVVNAG